jgi:hypothetical protein
LALLDTALQTSWLESVLILLYKYDINSQADNNSMMQILHICLSILRNGNHDCQPTPIEPNTDTFRSGCSDRHSEPKLSKLKVLKKYVNRDDQKKPVISMSVPRKVELNISWLVG